MSVIRLSARYTLDHWLEASVHGIAPNGRQMEVARVRPGQEVRVWHSVGDNLPHRAGCDVSREAGAVYSGMRPAELDWLVGPNGEKGGVYRFFAPSIVCEVRRGKFPCCIRNILFVCASDDQIAEAIQDVEDERFAEAVDVGSRWFVSLVRHHTQHHPQHTPDDPAKGALIIRRSCSSADTFHCWDPGVLPALREMLIKGEDAVAYLARFRPEVAASIRHSIYAQDLADRLETLLGFNIAKRREELFKRGMAALTKFSLEPSISKELVALLGEKAGKAAQWAQGLCNERRRLPEFMGLLDKAAAHRGSFGEVIKEFTAAGICLPVVAGEDFPSFLKAVRVAIRVFSARPVVVTPAPAVGQPAEATHKSAPIVIQPTPPPSALDKLMGDVGPVRHLSMVDWLSGGSKPQ